MDLVSRLKLFMDSQQITISQFADGCNIPRPTLSQILGGRNKKISDELIGKIHTAYPELSVTWLLFGEGDMRTNANIKISEPQNAPQLDFGDAQDSDHELFSGNEIDFNPVQENWSENFMDKFSDQTIAKGASKERNNENTSDKINVTTDSTKRIKNIVVFYDDNTFQTFDPSGV